MPLHSIPRGSIPTISASEFSRSVHTAELLARYNLEDPCRPCEIAVKRFLMGCTRDDAGDALVDFVVALEALLLPGRSESETSYRFRLHGAHVLATAPTERQNTYDRLKAVCNARSSLVHGGRPRGQAHEAMNDARTPARRGLLKAINGTFPDAVYFDRLLLSQEMC